MLRSFSVSTMRLSGLRAHGFRALAVLVAIAGLDLLSGCAVVRKIPAMTRLLVEARP